MIKDGSTILSEQPTLEELLELAIKVATEAHKGHTFCTARKGDKIH